MKIESLIFDIDGTLWDSRALVAEGYNIQLRQEGLSHLCVTAEDLRPLFGKVMTEIADSILAEIPVSRRYDLMERCMDTENRYLYENECNIGYPGVKETLEKLGIAHLFSGHLCFGDTGTKKGLTIRRLMAEHQISSAVYIGDTQGDLEATVVADIPFIWAAYGFGSPDSPAAKIDDIRQLPKVLEDM